MVLKGNLVEAAELTFIEFLEYVIFLGLIIASILFMFILFTISFKVIKEILGDLTYIHAILVWVLFSLFIILIGYKFNKNLQNLKGE